MHAEQFRESDDVSNEKELPDVDINGETLVTHDEVKFKAETEFSELR